MKLRVTTAPHIQTKNSVHVIMRDVLIALIPATVAGIYFFGINSAMLLFVATATAVVSEWLWQLVTRQTVRIGDLSAAVTGLILGLNLPPTAPWWIAVIGSVFAIIIVKQLFGGIGDNFLNPAMASRAVLLMSFPARMTAYIIPANFIFSNAVSDAVSAATSTDATSVATPLVNKGYSYFDLFFGNIPGTIGEVCKAAIIIGFLYLLARRVVRWHMPVIFTASAVLFTWMFSGFTVNPLTAVLSGGLLFGAVFMATDYTTTPMTPCGTIVAAVLAGIVLAVIRAFGSYPEGVTYAILIMNIITPLIDRYMKPKVYGEAKINE